KKLTICGNDASRVFDIVTPGVTVTIAKLTITHGFAVQGAGIDNGGGNVTVSSCILSSNTAAAGTSTDALGGGIFNDVGSTLTVTHTAFISYPALVADGSG